MKTYRAAIVGCGGIAQVHSGVIGSLPFTKLVACCDIIPERAEKMAAVYGCSSYTSLEKMLELEEIDVLHVCTPHYLHVPMIKAAAEKNIAVFSEKPPAISPEQWQELKTVTSVPVGICFQNRYNRSVQFVRELLTSGKAGKVLGARAFVTWSRGKEYYTKSGWRGSLKTEGGGVLINQSIHTMDLLIYLMGKPLSCEASYHNRHLEDVVEVEDTMEAYIKFDNCAALFYATTAYSADSPVLLELHCESMVIRMEEERVTVIHSDKTREEHIFAAPETPLGKTYWGNGHYTCISEFYKAIDKGQKPPIGISEVEDTVMTMLRAYGRV